MGYYKPLYNPMLRPKELETFKKIGVDEETYNILRSQKKLQSKSMMRIVKNLIIEKYGVV